MLYLEKGFWKDFGMRTFRFAKMNSAVFNPSKEVKLKLYTPITFQKN